MESSVNAQIRRSFLPRWLRRGIGLVILLITLIMLVNMTAKPSGDLGVQDGRLAACPNKPNCVSTQADSAIQRIEPLVLTGDAELAAGRVGEVLDEMPRTTVIAAEDGYWRAESVTAILRFVDDLEVWIDADNRLIHARSASRVGYSDLGANRKRVERLFQQLVELGVGELSSDEPP